MDAENKIRYSNRRHNAAVKPLHTVHRLSLPVSGVEPATYSLPSSAQPVANGPTVHRYQQPPGGSAGGGSGGSITADDLAMIIAAIGNLEWVQWIKSQMAERELASKKAGGEAALEEPAAIPEVRPEREEPERMSADRLVAAAPRAELQKRYAAEQFEYRPTTVSAVERYTRRQADHLERCQRSDAEYAKREEVARRALQHAERHGTTYEDALTACGSCMPTEILPSCAV